MRIQYDFFNEKNVNTNSSHCAFITDIGKSHTVLPSGGLQISRATREDAGTYMCVAQNPAGTALGKIKLNVQGT